MSTIGYVLLLLLSGLLVGALARLALPGRDPIVYLVRKPRPSAPLPPR